MAIKGENLKPSKALIIGSGLIIIGQAAEFDYAGTQMKATGEVMAIDRCFEAALAKAPQAAVEALVNGSQIYSAQPLPDYRIKEPT